MIKCHYCGGTRCDHGDHCSDCGCPRCGFPGARHTEKDGFVRGFCPECEWEAVPGAFQAWKHRYMKRVRTNSLAKIEYFLLGKIPEDNVVGSTPILTESDWTDWIDNPVAATMGVKRS